MVADNLTVSTWTGRLCSAFRKLVTVMPLAWGFFYGPIVHASYESPDFYYESEHSVPFRGSTPIAVCKEGYQDVPNSITFSDHKVNYLGGDFRKYSCEVVATYASGSVSYFAFHIRTIGYCTSPYELDTETGMCTSCPTMVGEETSLNWPLGRYMSESESSFEEFLTPPPSSGCFNNCTATRSGFTGDPVMPSDGPFPRIVKSSIPYAYTGQACYSSSTEPVPPDFPASGGDSGGDTGGDTGGGDDGSGTGDGGSGGGTDGGSGGSSGGGSGGGGDTGGGDTGGGDTGGGDTGGDTGGGDTGGGDTGGGDTGGDTGGGNTGGGNSGDGDGGSAGGLACKQPLTCEGDAVQCAILRVQKEKLCAYLDGADFEGHRGEIESLFSGPDYQREADEEVTVPSFVTGITRFFPANTCPADAPISLSSFGGRTFKISYQPICSFASALGPLIVIAATVFAALYVGRAFGGE